MKPSHKGLRYGSSPGISGHLTSTVVINLSFVRAMRERAGWLIRASRSFLFALSSSLIRFRSCLES